jgi:hypothetical protein
MAPFVLPQPMTVEHLVVGDPDSTGAAPSGDELPETLASKAGRLDRLRQAKALLEAAERARRFAERVAASAAAAHAKGKPPWTLKPRARDEAPNPKATANVTDPDSRLLHTRCGRVQGYNAQAATTLEQVIAIVAAELATCRAAGPTLASCASCSRSVQTTKSHACWLPAEGVCRAASRIRSRSSGAIARSP